MANFADEPLTKVTVNLYTKDVEWMRERSPENWSELLRSMTRMQIEAIKEMARGHRDG